MEQYIIKGGTPLVGEVVIGGAKNAALGILAAAIMTDGQCLIDNMPNVRDTNVLLQGLGPVGLVMACVLRAAGINNIIAIDGTPMRLEMAKKIGVKTTINFREYDTLEKRIEAVKAATDGVGADFAFQCTGAPAAAADIYSYIRRGGGMCEMGFFVNNGEYSVNPHFAMCNKEINLVGSWDYSAQDYPKTIAFLKQAREMNIPIKSLITHSYPLDKLDEAMETNVSQQGIKICYVPD